MKKRKFIIALLLAVVLVIGLVVALLFEPSAPRYGGKDVYFWMFKTTSSDLAANPGLSAIGSNAVPYLARALATEKTPFEKYSFVRQPQVQKFLKHIGVGYSWSTTGAEIRHAALWSLLAFGFEAKPALPQLHAELLRTQSDDRQQVVHILAEIGPLPESIPYLVKAWPLATNEIYVVRHDLLHTLGHAGTNAAALAMPIALMSLDDPELDVRGIALNALAAWRQPAPEALPKVVAMLSSTNVSLATAAADALGCLTNRMDEAIPPLRRLLTNTNEYTQVIAAMTLWRLGGDAEETRRILEPLLSNKQAKGVAARSLARLGPAARASVPALLKASHEEIGAWVDMYDRALCAEAALRITGDSAEAIGVLEQALAYHANSWIQATVAEDIPKLGKLANPLIPALQRALQDPNRDVRYAAAQALAKLDKTPSQ